MRHRAPASNKDVFNKSRRKAETKNANLICINKSYTCVRCTHWLGVASIFWFSSSRKREKETYLCVFFVRIHMYKLSIHASMWTVSVSEEITSSHRLNTYLIMWCFKFHRIQLPAFFFLHKHIQTIFFNCTVFFFIRINTLYPHNIVRCQRTSEAKNNQREKKCLNYYKISIQHELAAHFDRL